MAVEHARSDTIRRLTFCTRGVGFNQGPGPQAAPDVDFIGLPMLAPNSSFTLAHGAPQAAGLQRGEDTVRDVRAAFGEGLKPTPAPSPTALPSGLREIGTVVSVRRDYDITLLPDETVKR